MDGYKSLADRRLAFTVAGLVMPCALLGLLEWFPVGVPWLVGVCYILAIATAALPLSTFALLVMYPWWDRLNQKTVQSMCKAWYITAPEILIYITTSIFEIYVLNLIGTPWAFWLALWAACTATTMVIFHFVVQYRKNDE